MRERIKQSAVQRDSRETAITVTTSDDDLSKGHAEYLEAQLIELTTQAGRASTDNGTNPTSSRSRLCEANQANPEQFLSSLKIVLPVIDHDILKPQPRAATHLGTVEQRPAGEKRIEIRHKNGVQAEAVEEHSEFSVLEGSQALINTGFFQQSYSALQKKLPAEGVFAPSKDNRTTFAEPRSFSSPSAAVAVVLDRNSNERIEWKIKEPRQSYHDWQQARAAEGDATRE